MLYFSTPTILANFLPEVELEARALVTALAARSSLAQFMAQLGARLEPLQVKQDWVWLQKSVLRHGPAWSELRARLRTELGLK